MITSDLDRNGVHHDGAHAHQDADDRQCSHGEARGDLL